MSRMLKSLSGRAPESQRSADQQSAADASQPHLSVVRPGDTPYVPLHRGMWNDDAQEDPTLYTTEANWPDDAAFEQMISLAVARGDKVLAATLQADRHYCAEARASLAAQQNLVEETTA
jgi:hypothetical protein